MKSSEEKIAILTAYDSSMAQAVQAAGIDAILVGDSLGMVVQGQRDTAAVSLADIAYHVRAVVAGAPDAFVIADLPFGFQESPEKAFNQARQLVAAGAAMVKLEGGQEIAPTINFCVTRGIPVCAHIGILPQSVRTGSYRVQGRDAEQAQRLREDAGAVEEAGAACVVLELIAEDLSATISEQLNIPTIGIGSGAECDGQVLVLYDMLGITPVRHKFVRDFLADTPTVTDAVRAYITAVKTKQFPTASESFR